MFRRTSQRSDGKEVELLRALVRLGNQLQSSLELQAVVSTIASAMAETFGYGEATVFIRVDDSDEFRAHATVGQDPVIDRLVLDTVVPGRVFRELFQERFQIGYSYFIDHLEFEWRPEVERYFPAPPLSRRGAGEFHDKDALFVPLYDKAGALTAVLDLFDPADGRRPTLEAMRPIEVFATHASAAIENALRYEELQRTSLQLAETLRLRHDLLDLSTALLSTLDPKRVFEQLAETLKTLVDYDTMDVRLVDEKAGELVCIFARDTSAEEMLDFRSPLGVGVTGWVVEHNQAQLINDMVHDPRQVQVPGTPEGEAQASIIVPLNVRGVVSGALTIDRLGGGVFEDRELETAQLFANLAAIAIQNARTYNEMELQAISDGLTGIYNYRHFRDNLSATLRRAERYDETFCLLMMDLDHFKTVNDTVGHQQGDEVLRGVARVLQVCSRESDYLARYGGEEFVMILPRTTLVEARNMAERICATVREIDPGVPGLQVSMSIGVASYPESSRNADGVLGAADAALLRAKARGRNRVCLYADEARAHTLLDGHMVALGRRFSAAIGLSEDETAALVTALAVFELTGTDGGEARRVLADRLPGSPEAGASAQRPPEPALMRRLAYDALLYANERWDGGGYPEGLRGERIPQVARALAVCRSYLVDEQQDSEARLAPLRAKAAHELDPRLVQRLTAMVRDEAVKAEGGARS